MKLEFSVIFHYVSRNKSDGDSCVVLRDFKLANKNDETQKGSWKGKEKKTR